MIYKVKAKISEDTIGEFYRKLADGTVAKQRPDGEEITASMKRAVLTAPGVAEWYEKCFCPTPLYHERQTQYDFYFSDMTTTEAEGYGEIKGESLWDYMASKGGQQDMPNQSLQDKLIEHKHEARARRRSARGS